MDETIPKGWQRAVLVCLLAAVFVLLLVLARAETARHDLREPRAKTGGDHVMPSSTRHLTTSEKATVPVAERHDAQPLKVKAELSSTTLRVGRPEQLTLFIEKGKRFPADADTLRIEVSLTRGQFFNSRSPEFPLQSVLRAGKATVELDDWWIAPLSSTFLAGEGGPAKVKISVRLLRTLKITATEWEQKELGSVQLPEWDVTIDANGMAFPFDVHPGKPFRNLLLTIDCEDIYAPGQPVTFTVHEKNVGKKEITLAFYRFPWDYQLTVLDADGRSVEKAGEARKAEEFYAHPYPISRPVGLYRLQPGEEFKRTYDLRAYVTALSPGEYSLQVMRRSGIMDDSEDTRGGALSLPCRFTIQ